MDPSISVYLNICLCECIITCVSVIDVRPRLEDAKDLTQQVHEVNERGREGLQDILDGLAMLPEGTGPIHSSYLQLLILNLPETNLKKSFFRNCLNLCWELH